MELLNKIKQLSVYFLVGILLIVVVGMAVVYIQQDKRQAELNAQIDQLSVTFTNPAPDTSELRTQYAEVNQKFKIPPLETIIETLLIIAEDNGIDVNPENESFMIPHQILDMETLIGGTTYRTLVFNNVKVQGNQDSVMGFIAALQGGDELPTLVINVLVIRDLDPTLESVPSEHVIQANLNLSIYYKEIVE